MGSREIIYRTDWNGNITFVGGDWDRFARENMAPELVGVSVIGRPLEDFIAGDEIRHLYALLIEKVHRTNEPATVSFRCDSPTVRRFMELEIRPLKDKATGFHSRLLREEATEYLPLLDRGQPRSETLLRVCSWCRFVAIDDEWVAVDEAVRRLQLFDGRVIPGITHGICTSCRKRLTGK